MKWEYKIETDTTKLNELGGEGWELVSAVWFGGSFGKIMYYMKRQILSTQPSNGGVM